MNRQIKIIAVCLLTIAMVACGSSAPSNSAVETAIALTQVASPTQTPIPTPTPIPLSDINLEEILLLQGDLPTVFIGGQIKSKPPRPFQGVPAPDQVVQEDFKAGAYASDGIVIALYESPSDIEAAYSTVTKAVAKEKDRSIKPLSDVGEQATIAEETLLGVTSIQVVFTRCHALVYIDLFSTSATTDVAITYAQRVDKRLSSLVCP